MRFIWESLLIFEINCFKIEKGRKYFREIVNYRGKNKGFGICFGGIYFF